MVLSQKRRHEGPQQTNILVTHLPGSRARQVIEAYGRRWAVARRVKALTGATGLGQPQVTKEPQRIACSVAIALMASLLRLKFRARDLPAQGPWSAFTRNRHFPWQVAQVPIEPAVEPRLRQARQERNAA